MIWKERRAGVLLRLPYCHAAIERLVSLIGQPNEDRLWKQGWANFRTAQHIIVGLNESIERGQRKADRR